MAETFTHFVSIPSLSAEMHRLAKQVIGRSDVLDGHYGPEELVQDTLAKLWKAYHLGHIGAEVLATHYFCISLLKMAIDQKLALLTDKRKILLHTVADMSASVLVDSTTFVDLSNIFYAGHEEDEENMM